MHRHEALPLGLLLLAYLVLAGLFALRTPAWQTPDEPAHYNYVRQLVAGDLPVIAPGDWDQAYLGQIVGAEFDPALSIDRLTYEDWQPPLYYLLQAPVYALSGGSLRAMRLLSVALGAGVVLLAYVVGRAVFGGTPAALAVAVFVAFLPQHLAVLGSVNNDSLTELLIAAVLALLVTPWPPAAGAARRDRRETRRLLALGALLGAGFLTKGQAYLMAPVVAVFLLARHWPAEATAARRLLGALLLVFGPALLLGALWWGRNLAIYGGLDVLGKAAHDAAVIGQPRTAEWLAQYGLAGTIGRFLRTTFVSFWGQFGWMAAPLPGWMAAGLAALTGVAVVGLALGLDDGRRTADHGQQTDASKATHQKAGAMVRSPSSVVPSARRLQALVLALTFLLTVALHVFYNLTFVQHQGRYLYPALIPIAVGFTAGLGFWLRPLARRWPAAAWLLPLGYGVVLGGIALFALWRILPGLAPG